MPNVTKCGRNFGFLSWQKKKQKEIRDYFKTRSRMYLNVCVKYLQATRTHVGERRNEKGKINLSNLRRFEENETKIFETRVSKKKLFNFGRAGERCSTQLTILHRVTYN